MEKKSSQWIVDFALIYDDSIYSTDPSIASGRIETPDQLRPPTPPASPISQREFCTPNHSPLSTPEPSTGEPAYFISPAGSPAPTPPPSVAEAREGSPDYSLPPTPPPSVAECRYDTPAYTPPPTPEPSIGKKWSKITSVLSLRLEKITHGGNGDLISDSCWVIRCSVTIRMYHSDRCWVEL